MTEAEADAAAGGSPSDQGAAVTTLTKKQKKQKEQDQLTKRQRRKQPNDEHLWPQHPKIQSPAGRARAYLRTAGLYAGGSKNKTLESIDPAIDLNSPQIKFGRLLGATDQRVRHEAVLQLSAYLKARCDISNETGGLSELDLLKLWKGLWYTLYMADKVPVQDELSAKIAELIWCVAGTEEEDEYAGTAYLDMFGDDGADVGFEDDGSDSDDEVQMEEIENTLGDDEGYEEHSDDDNSMDSEDSDGDSDEEEGDEEHVCVDSEEDEEELEELHDSEIPHCRGAHLASLFVRTFFATVRREWGKMDKYRVDKFYTLMRLMMQQVYKYMAVRHWNLGIIRLFNDALYEEILSQTPNGLRYHLIDIALDELAAVHAEAPMPLTEATFLDCMEPFFAMAQTGAGGHDVVQARVVENVLSKFLEKYSVVSEGADDTSDEEENNMIFDEVRVETVSQFIFQIASDAATTDKYRKSLYDLHKQYVRRLKQAGHDVGNDDSFEGDDAIPDEVEDLPEDSEMQDDQEAEEIMKETKSEKKKRKKQEQKDSKEAVASESPAPVNVKAHEKKEKKSDKKKKALPKDSDNESQASENVKDHDKKEKKNKKKKKQKGSDSSAQAHDEGRDAEEITISMEEQKAAKHAMQPKRKSPEEDERPSSVGKTPDGKRRKKDRNSTEVISSPQDQKRVTFTPQNKFRSWKASMKGLNTMDRPPTPDKTPEKSILRRRTSAEKAKAPPKGKTGKRKKATDYFG
jgi:hypothetical protein